jgi:pimeloyl-ACP methyl ester carboxylesterase
MYTCFSTSSTFDSDQFQVNAIATYSHTMTMPKPTIVLVHGAWHSPEHFKPVIEVLESHNYKTAAVSCPSSSPTATATPATFEDDCSAVRSVVLRELESADVLVVCHSYGGVPGSNALQGLSPPARAASNDTTSVTGIAYMCAAVLPAGITFLQAIGGQPLQIHDLSVHEGFARVGEPGPKYYFYNDLPDDEAKHWASLLRLHSWKTATDGFVEYEAYAEIPAHYLYCTLDQALELEAQKGMVAQAEARSGRAFRTEEVESSHSPFLSMPGRTAEFVRRSAGEEV